MFVMESQTDSNNWLVLVLSALEDYVYITYLSVYDSIWASQKK